MIARRDLFRAAAAGSLFLAAARTAQAAPPARHEQRIAWWQDAKFGMFVHFGLYSLIGQHEWALEAEGIPLADYEKLAPHFKPRPEAPREWARLAKKAGQNERGLRLTGLPAAPPDQPVTVIAIECDGPIVLDHVSDRKTWKRGRA